MAERSITDEIMETARSGNDVWYAGVNAGIQNERKHGENTVKLRALCAAVEAALYGLTKGDPNAAVDLLRAALAEARKP